MARKDPAPSFIPPSSIPSPAIRLAVSRADAPLVTLETTASGLLAVAALVASTLAATAMLVRAATGKRGR